MSAKNIPQNLYYRPGRLKESLPFTELGWASIRGYKCEKSLWGTDTSNGPLLEHGPVTDFTVCY